MVRIQRYEAVEIQVPNGSTLTRFYFPDLPNLRNAQITSLEYYSASTLGVSPLTGSALVANTDAAKSFLTLYQGDLQLVYNIPLVTLSEVNNLVTPFRHLLPSVANILVSWVKSYVTLFTALVTTNVVYAFGVYYNFGDQDNNMSNAGNPAAGQR
jgi:hypothetical protein